MIATSSVASAASGPAAFDNVVEVKAFIAENYMTQTQTNGAGGPVVERNLLVRDVVDRLGEALGAQMNEKDEEIARLKAQLDAIETQRTEALRERADDRTRRRSLQPGYQPRGANAAAAADDSMVPPPAPVPPIGAAAAGPSVLNHLHNLNEESTPAQISVALAAGNLLRAQKRQSDDANRPERQRENKRLKKLETVTGQISKANTEKTNCENLKAQLEALPKNQAVTKQIGDVTKQIAFWDAKLSDYDSYKTTLENQATPRGSSDGTSAHGTPR